MMKKRSDHNQKLRADRFGIVRDLYEFHYAVRAVNCQNFERNYSEVQEKTEMLSGFHCHGTGDKNKQYVLSNDDKTALSRIRTTDLFITNEVLCQLS